MIRRLRLAALTALAGWLIPGAAIVAARRRWYGPNGERVRR